MLTKTDKKKIVVVDDEPIIISMLKEVLSEGYHVYTAINGRLAISEVKKTKPDMVILDILMPEMDGFEACKELKEDKDTAGIPVILLTAKGMITDIEKGLKSGADAYIVKPFSPFKLIQKMEEIFGKRIAG